MRRTDKRWRPVCQGFSFYFRHFAARLELMLLQRRASVTCAAIAQHVRKLLGFSGRAMSREAFGVRGACCRFRARLVIESAGKPGHTPNASRRSVAAPLRCVFALNFLLNHYGARVAYRRTVGRIP